MDLSRTDLLQLLSCLEGELQARDVTIAALKVIIFTIKLLNIGTLKIIIPPAKHSFRGVSCFQHVGDSGILSTFKVFITLIAFVRFCSNLHHTLTIRQCMFGGKIGAEGSVLQELCHFVILTIRCLYYH